MLIVLMCLALPVPQLIARQLRVSPAAHLTLLLFGLCAVTVTLATQSPNLILGSTDTSYSTALSPLGYAIAGLALLTPAYWVIEQLCPLPDSQVDVVLIETLSLVVAAALLETSTSIPQLLTEFCALVLVTTLAVRAAFILKQAHDQK